MYIYIYIYNVYLCSIARHAVWGLRGRADIHARDLAMLPHVATC